MPTKEELLKKGAKPVTRKYTREELLRMGAKPAQSAPMVTPSPVPTKKKEPGGVLDYLSDVAGAAKEGGGQILEGLSVGLRGLFRNPFSEESRALPYEQTPLGGVSTMVKGGLGLLASPVTPVINKAAELTPGGSEALGQSFDYGAQVGRTLQSGAEGIRKVFGKAAIPDSGAGRVAARDMGKATESSIDVAQSIGIPKSLRVAGKTVESGLEGAVNTAGKMATSSKAKVPKIVRKRTEVLLGLEKNNASLRKLMEKERARGFDPAKDIAATDLLVDSVNKDGLVTTKGPGGAIDQYQAKLHPIEGKITEALRNEGKRVPLSTVRSAMIREVEGSGMKMASKAKALKAIEEEIAGLRLDADEFDMVDLTDVQLGKIDKYANVNYMNESGRFDKAIARALKRVVEENMESLDAKAANAVLARHKVNLKYLEYLDGRKVSGGRLGKYFATTVGAIIGSHFGPFGAMGGAELGNRIKGGLMSRTFGKMTGRNMELTPEELQAFTPKEVVKPKLLGPGPILAGPKPDASGPIKSPFRPGYGMAAPDDFYRGGQKLLPTRANGQTIRLPQSVRESNLGLDEVRSTVAGQRSSSSNSLGSRQMAQTTKATNPITPNTIIEGQVKSTPTEVARQATSLPKARVAKSKAVEVPKAKAEVEVLPTDASIADEARLVGQKRIAPDRVPHQKLTPEEGMEALVEVAKKKADRGADSWLKVADKIDALVQKYGERMPVRTAENMRKYPSLVDDSRLFSDLKKYGGGHTTLVGVRDWMKQAADRSKWNAAKEEAFRGKVGNEYKALVRQDISKGYRYPDSVLDYDPSFRRSVDARARYEKGLHTSFSADDTRIVFDDQKRISSGMKRQDGKAILPEQRDEIVNGFLDTQEKLGLDLDRLARDEKWVLVHLNGKNPFLTKNASGLYRVAKGNKSVSVGGTESYPVLENGKTVQKKFNTTIGHEIGHALDFFLDKKFIDEPSIQRLRYSYNPVMNSPRGTAYWRSNAEITARAISQYIAEKGGHKGLFEKPGQWPKNIYESVIVPAVEKTLKEKLGEYRTAPNS